MHRRHFVQSALASSASLGWTTRLQAAENQTAATPRLLIVFLRGGYDATSLLVPRNSSFYSTVRPNIAIPVVTSANISANITANISANIGERTGENKGENKGENTGAAPLNSDWALHPALQSSVLPLVLQQQACFVPFAGTADMSRSHFETQDSIELGQALGAQRNFGSGFMNRLAAVLQAPTQAMLPNASLRDAIAFTDQLPLVLRGERSVANLSLKTEPKPGDARLRQALLDMYRDHALQARVAESFDVRDGAAKDMAKDTATDRASEMVGEAVAANRNAINAKGFELEARRIARLMRERYALGFVDVGGWDTHVGQGAATGYLATRFEELGRGLAGFAAEMGPAAWRNTVVVVLSEFGRTLRENGNRGTDHGHGSVYWVLGGSLKAAAVVGEQKAIEARTLNQNRDLPVLNDYRELLGGLLARQFSLSPAQLQTVFPGATPRDWGIL